MRIGLWILLIFVLVAVIPLAIYHKETSELNNQNYHNNEDNFNNYLGPNLDSSSGGNIPLQDLSLSQNRKISSPINASTSWKLIKDENLKNLHI